jgi:ligand-binding SRPBCC domain-containing protein
MGTYSTTKKFIFTMSTFQLIRTQKLPVDKKILWEFVSSPHNLKEITPAYMNFQVLSQQLYETMYPGMIITYKVSPLLKIPLHWCTEISVVEPMNYFVDEQREGPYRFWHHQHHLETIEGGTLMTDIVSYRLPMGVLGRIAHSLFVKKQLESIFDFRYQKMKTLFGEM